MRNVSGLPSGRATPFFVITEVLPILEKVEDKLTEFQTKPFIWTGTCFAIPDNVAKHWKKNGPHLYKLPDILSECKHLLETLNIKTDFNMQKLLDTFQCMFYENKSKTELLLECHELIDCIILELNATSGETTELAEVILLDDLYVLRPGKELSFNDGPYLPPAKDCNYVHSKLIRGKALLFGVKPIRSKFLENFASPQSQHFADSEFG